MQRMESSGSTADWQKGHFFSLGFETLGSWGQEATKFVSQIGKNIKDATGEDRSTSF